MSLRCHVKSPQRVRVAPRAARCAGLRRAPRCALRRPHRAGDAIPSQTKGSLRCEHVGSPYPLREGAVFTGLRREEGPEHHQAEERPDHQTAPQDEPHFEPHRGPGGDRGRLGSLRPRRRPAGG